MHTVDWLPSYERLDAYWGEVDRKWAPDFKVEPDLIVVHSAAVGNWPAEYLHNPVDKTNGHLCKDGVKRGIAAAHFAFYEGRTEKLRPGTTPPAALTFVQMASLLHTCPHVGGSVCQDDEHPNRRSVGIELPAKLNMRDQFLTLLNDLLEAVGTFKFWTTHKAIHPAKKTDPVAGSGFNLDWMTGTGLKFVGRRK